MNTAVHCKLQNFYIESQLSFKVRTFGDCPITFHYAGSLWTSYLPFAREKYFSLIQHIRKVLINLKFKIVNVILSYYTETTEQINHR